MCREATGLSGRGRRPPSHSFDELARGLLVRRIVEVDGHLEVPIVAEDEAHERFRALVRRGTRPPRIRPPAVSSYSGVANRFFRYAALGDSSAVGVGASDGGYPERLGRRVKDLGIPVGLLNLGISGATAAQIAGPVAQRAAGNRPDMITLGIGTNDAWRLVPEESFARHLAAIADQVDRCGAPVIVFNIADLGRSPAARIASSWVGITAEQITARVQELNRHIAALAARPGWKLVDLFSQSREAMASRNDLFSPDGFHPSAAGYALWAELAWPQAREIAERWRARASASA
jgi:lysophospholipase L1-like esterase